MSLDANPNCNIFTALHEALTAKAEKQLKFAKCHNCGRFTPYRLRFLKTNTGLNCKNCGTHLL